MTNVNSSVPFFAIASALYIASHFATGFSNLLTWSIVAFSVGAIIMLKTPLSAIFRVFKYFVTHD